MYIISKEKDYYDTCASLGIDKTLLYKRDLWADESTTVGTDICEKFLTPSGFWDKFNTQIYSTWRVGDPRKNVGLFLHVIGFCGKLYPLVQYRHEVREYHMSNPTPVSEMFYIHDMERLKCLVAQDEMLSYCLSKEKYYKYGTRKKETDWDRFYTSVKELHDKEYLEPFIEYSTPIFYIGLVPTRETKNHTLFTNPLLKQYEFHRVKDPYTAWQEISMFLGGVIPRQVPETVEIKDKDRITGHGFDKWSFRNHKDDK